MRLKSDGRFGLARQGDLNTGLGETLRRPQQEWVRPVDQCMAVQVGVTSKAFPSLTMRCCFKKRQDPPDKDREKHLHRQAH